MVVVVEDEKAAVVTVGEDGPSSASLFCLCLCASLALSFPRMGLTAAASRSSYRRVSQISQFERLYELRNVHAVHDHRRCLPGALMSAVPSRCGETEGVERPPLACECGWKAALNPRRRGSSVRINLGVDTCDGEVHIGT